MATVFALVADHKPQFLNSNGDPASGYQLFVYTAGSSSKATTYTESGGLVANANPIVLDSRGETPSGVYAESGTYKLVLASDTDTDPPSSAIWTRDNVKPINDTTTVQSQWTASGLTPTFTSTTTFTLVGDQRTEFHVGRRLKLTDSGGTDYGTIVTSAFTTLTTITVGVDAGGVLDSGLSAVSYGLETATNQSLPEPWVKGADIASATVLPVNVPGTLHDVTGTVPVTSMAAMRVGTVKVLQFDDIVPFTHHATNLILDGGDITTANGDVLTFYEYASGDWRLIGLQRDAMAKFRAYNSAVTNITGTAEYIAVFDQVAYDTGSDFNGTTTFTAPATGYYLLCASVRVSGITGAADEIKLTISTTLDDYQQHKTSTNGLGSQESLSVSVVANMDVGDSALIKIQVIGETGNPCGISAGLAHFSGARID